MLRISFLSFFQILFSFFPLFFSYFITKPNMLKMQISISTEPVGSRIHYDLQRQTEEFVRNEMYLGTVWLCLGSGGDKEEMNYQLEHMNEKKKILKNPESSYMTNRRKRFSCWHLGVLSSEQCMSCFGLDLGPQLMFTLQIATRLVF